MKAGGGRLCLVVEGQVEEMLERSGVLLMVECQVYPTVYDAVELDRMDRKHRRHL